MNMEKDEQCDSHLYESNIHPVIRFIHETKIQPANWVDIDITEEDYESKSNYSVKIKYRYLCQRFTYE